MRGATPRRDYGQDSSCNFNPRSSCEERPDVVVDICEEPEKISIHAPHARSDMSKAAEPLQRLEFQSTLLMRGATITFKLVDAVDAFQSTLLMRGATSGWRAPAMRRVYFNPRSSCEERRALAEILHDCSMISIHAPHARSDKNALRGYHDFEISIHAPHARSDAG